MKNHGKKMIAPVIVTICFVLYYAGIAVLFLAENTISVPMKLLIVVAPLALAGVMIGVLVSRIKEIRSGEEDDLSKY